MFPTAQGRGFVKVFFDVVTVGADHNEISALDQIAKGVGYQFTADAMGNHLQDGLHV